MRFRNRIRRLENIGEVQQDAIVDWRDSTRFEVDPIRMPGCRLYTNVVDARFSESFAGRARWAIPIADSRDLVGHTLYGQAFLFDATANARGIAVSDASAMRIGER